MVMVDEATYKEMEQATAAVRALQVAAEQAQGMYEAPKTGGTVAENATVETPKVAPKVGAKKV
jgi:hypothetical protein